MSSKFPETRNSPRHPGKHRNWGLVWLNHNTHTDQTLSQWDWYEMSNFWSNVAVVTSWIRLWITVDPLGRLRSSLQPQLTSSVVMAKQRSNVCVVSFNDTFQTVHPNFETEQQTQTLSKIEDGKWTTKQQMWFLTCCNEKREHEKTTKGSCLEVFLMMLRVSPRRWDMSPLFLFPQQRESRRTNCTRCPGEVAACWPNWQNIFVMFGKQFSKKTPTYSWNIPQTPTNGLWRNSFHLGV